jgi:hypothetical protein
LGEDFEGGVGVAGVFGTEGLDEFGGALDFVGEVAFVKEAVESGDVGLKSQADGARFGGEVNGFLESVDGEPLHEGELVVRRKVEETVVAACFGGGEKIIWEK